MHLCGCFPVVYSRAAITFTINNMPSIFLIHLLVDKMSGENNSRVISKMAGFVQRFSVDKENTHFQL